MTTSLGKDEIAILKKIKGQNKSSISIHDFLRAAWTEEAGAMELNSHTAHFYLPEGKGLSLEDFILPMQRLVSVLSLIKRLEKEGLLLSWYQADFQQSDFSIGKKPENCNVHLLPDFSHANELLAYTAKRFVFSDRLVQLLNNNTAGTINASLKKSRLLLSIGLIVIALLLAGNIYVQYTAWQKGIKIKVEELNQQNAQFLDQQKQQSEALEKLKAQNDSLLSFSKQISSNTEEVSAINQRIRNLSYITNQGNRSIGEIKKEQEAIKALLEEINKDSLQVSENK